MSAMSEFHITYQGRRRRVLALTLRLYRLGRRAQPALPVRIAWRKAYQMARARLWLRCFRPFV
jgi:hypothetical protein